MTSTRAQNPSATTGTVATVTSPVSSIDDYAIVSRGPNHAIRERTVYEPGPSGQLVPRVHRVTELGSGLNHLNDQGQWEPSRDDFEITSEGYAVARHCQHKLTVAPNLNSPQGVLLCQASDGARIRTAVLGLVLFDPASGKTLQVASVKDCPGQQTAPNEITFPDAFHGLKAGVRIRNERGRFHEEVLLSEKLTPRQLTHLGFSPDSVRLEIWTEFLEAPTPTIQSSIIKAEPDPARRAAMADPDAVDDFLDFAALKMAPGTAFIEGHPGNSAVIFKRWFEQSGRRFLIEACDYADLAPLLVSLPETAQLSPRSPTKALLAQSRSTGSRSSVPQRLALRTPPARAAANPDRNFQIARLDASLARPSAPQINLDFTMLSGTRIGYVFQRDGTYFITSSLSICGDSTWEGGAVLKFARGASVSLVPCAGGVQVHWLATQYSPVVFTAVDDNSIGEPISYGALSGYYANPALGLITAHSANLANLRISYASQAISMGAASADISHLQILNCQNGLTMGGSTANLHNALFANTPTIFNFSGSCSVTGEHLTCHQSTYLVNAPLPGCSLHLTNCIFSGIANLSAGVLTLDGSHNGFYGTTTPFGDNHTTTLNYPFELAGAGAYYLAEDAFRGIGTPTISQNLLADLKNRTTHPPAVISDTTITDDTNFTQQVARENDGILDLGYAYDPLDWYFNGVTVDASLDFAPGTACAWSVASGYGLQINDGHNVSFNGTATDPCYWVRRTTVQEGGGAEPWAPGSITASTWPNFSQTPVVSLRFTRLSIPGSDMTHMRDNYGYLIVHARDCEFWGGSLGGYCSQLNYTNCLFDRVTLWTAWDGPPFPTTDCTLVLQNCLMRGGWLNLGRAGPDESGHFPLWSVHDTAFDRTTISFWVDAASGDLNYTAFDYNAFLEGANTTVPTGDNDISVDTFNWQSNHFGAFYLPSDSRLKDCGSTNADAVGLFYFTTQTNQLREANTQLDRSYHYVAVGTNGSPLITAGGTAPDFLPDYLADIAGRGPQLTVRAYKRTGSDIFYVWITNSSGVNIVGGSFDLFVFFTPNTPTLFTALQPWGADSILPKGGRLFTFCTTDDSITNYDCNVVYTDPDTRAISSPRFRITSDSALVVANTTQVPNPCLECGPCEPAWVGPQPRPPCGDGVTCACDPQPLPASSSAGAAWMRLDNFYKTNDPAQNVDLTGSAHGFKNVYAIKQWHGAFGPKASVWGPLEGADGKGTCRAAAKSPPLDSTKYRTISATGSAHGTGTGCDGHTPGMVCDGSASSTCTVGRYTGRLSGTGGSSGYLAADAADAIATVASLNIGGVCDTYSGLLAIIPLEYPDHYNEFGDLVMAPVAVTYSDFGTSISATWSVSWDLKKDCPTAGYTEISGSYSGSVSCDLIGGSVTCSSDHNSAESGDGCEGEDWSVSGDEHYGLTVTLGDNSAFYSETLTHTSSNTNANSSEHREATVTYLDPYTSDDLNADCDVLLAQWNLFDDIQYPWRTDPGINRGPLVTYNERAENTPIILSRPMNDTASAPWSSQPDGATLGAPLPVYGPNGEIYSNEAYFDFHHLNWRFDDTDCSSPGTIVSYGAYSPYPNATQWTDEDMARVFPGGPFWAYGSDADALDHFMFRLKDPYIMDTFCEWEQGGYGGLIKCKWAETIESPDFVFKNWNFNFKDFIESYRWCSTVWSRNHFEPSCASLSGCDPVRFTPIEGDPGQPWVGYAIGPGSWWISGMTCAALEAQATNCCYQPAVYVQPDSPGQDCSNRVFVAMPPAACDPHYGSLWMGRVDQSTSDSHSCDYYVANRNNGVANPPSCDPQIELDLIWHDDGGGYETFVAPLGFTVGGQAICDKPAINSLDGYIEIKVPDACVEAIGGVEKFGLTLTGARGENYQIALKNATIYQPPSSYLVDVLDNNGNPTGDHVNVQEGAFFPDAEVQRMDPNDCIQPIAVIHENGYYRFMTVFDTISAVRVSFTQDGQVVAGWDYYLKPYAPMADLIQQLDAVLMEAWANFGPTPGCGFAGLRLNSQTSCVNRSLIAKCCSAVFEQVESAVQAGVVVYVEGVKTAVLAAQGFVQGFWGGVKNDYNNVKQFITLVRHPIDTSKAIYEGFRGLVNMGLDGLKQIPKKMLEEYLTDAQKSISWLDPTGDDRLALIAYTVGYSAGFISEQLLVSTLTTVFKAAVVLPAVTSAAAKIGSSIATMMSSIKAGNKILRAVELGQEAAANLQKAKNIAVKTVSQFVREKAGLDKVEGIVRDVLCAGCAP